MLLNAKCKMHSVATSLGLVHLYSIPIPVYGPKPYTAIEKKIDIDQKDVQTVEIVQTGSGEQDVTKTSSEEKLKASSESAESPKSDPVLDRLNGRKKEKLDSKIYSSFLNPSSIQTASISIGEKRKNSTKNELQLSEPLPKKKAFEQKHKFNLI